MSKRKSRPILAVRVACALLAAAALSGCDDHAAPANAPTTAPTSRPANAIVSLSPAATDLLLAMNARDAIVGISSYDIDPRVADLPRVGAYLDIDWERVAALEPKHLFIQMAADRIPAGFNDRAERLHAAVHRIQIDRLDDITRSAEQIGSDIGRPEAGAQLAKSMRDAIDRIRASVAGKPPVRTLIALSEDGLTVAGPGTYLDDLLTAAGGTNVLGAERPGYSQIDRELLLTLAPDAIIQLAPLATPAQRAANEQTWKLLPTLPAVEHGRVLTIVEPYAMMPGSHVVDLGRSFASFLHPEAR